MKDILKNFNDEAGFHVEESEQEAEYIDKDGDKNFRKLFKLFAYNAIGGIRRTVPKIGEENIYEEKERVNSLAFLYAFNKTFETLNKNNICLSELSYEAYLRVIKEKIYNLKKRDIKYKKLYYYSSDKEDLRLYEDVLNTNRKLLSLELDEEYLRKNYSKVNEAYYNFVSIAHDLINQNAIMFLRIKKHEEELEKRKKLKTKNKKHK